MGYRGQIVRTEVTQGHNGWHVHLHVLIFFLPIDGERYQSWRTAAAGKLEALDAAIYARWSGALGDGYKPSRQHGLVTKWVDPLRVAEEVAAYVAKGAAGDSIGAELADFNSKRAGNGNVTPWDLLGAAIAGHHRSRNLWAEWEQGSRGKRAIVWSPGLHELLDVPPVDDEDVDQEQHDPAIVAVRPALWLQIRRDDRVVSLLEVAEAGYRAGRGHQDGMLTATIEVLAQLEAWGYHPGQVRQLHGDVDPWGVAEP